jgi:hypothetical protein
MVTPVAMVGMATIVTKEEETKVAMATTGMGVLNKAMVATWHISSYYNYVGRSGMFP